MTTYCGCWSVYFHSLPLPHHSLPLQVEYLLERGAEVNTGVKSSSLHYAACFGRPSIVKVRGTHARTHTHAYTDDVSECFVRHEISEHSLLTFLIPYCTISY